MDANEIIMWTGVGGTLAFYLYVCVVYVAADRRPPWQLHVALVGAVLIWGLISWPAAVAIVVASLLFKR